MAGFTYNLPDDLQNQLEKLSSEVFAAVAPKMINAATPILAKSVEKNLKIHKKSGELEKSITASKPKITKGAVSGGVTFKGYDKKTKVSNNQKAISLQYGTSKQNATPFLETSINEVEPEMIETMQEVFYTEVGSR